MGQQPEDAELIEQDIADRRRRMADTVDQLAAKADVPAQLRKRAGSAGSVAGSVAEYVRNHPDIVAAVVLAFLIGRLTRRR
jgi:hypothetical protein